MLVARQTAGKYVLDYLIARFLSSTCHLSYLFSCLLQASLLEERDLGVLLSLVTLLLGIVSRSYEGYESLVPRIVRLLHRLNPEKERDAAGRTMAPDRASVPPEYAYYGIPSPWLQVRHGLTYQLQFIWHFVLTQVLKLGGSLVPLMVSKLFSL